MLISSGPLTLRKNSSLVLFFTEDHVEEGGVLPQEGHGALGGHGFSQQGFPRSWRSVQQDSGPVQTQRQELWMLQRKLDRVQDVLLGLLQASDVLPAHSRNLLGHRNSQKALFTTTAEPNGVLHLGGPDGFGLDALQGLQGGAEVLVQDGHSTEAQILLLPTSAAQTGELVIVQG